MFSVGLIWSLAPALPSPCSYKTSHQKQLTRGDKQQQCTLCRVRGPNDISGWFVLFLLGHHYFAIILCHGPRTPHPAIIIIRGWVLHLQTSYLLTSASASANIPSLASFDNDKLLLQPSRNPYQCCLRHILQKYFTFLANTSSSRNI